MPFTDVMRSVQLVILRLDEIALRVVIVLCQLLICLFGEMEGAGLASATDRRRLIGDLGDMV